MTTSVLIIAHNEEAYIGACIQSVLNQTMRADEVVLIAHNCTDNTVAIANTYPIAVVEYQGPVGITRARIRGLDVVSGDIIICIDGDSVAEHNWIEVMSATLTKHNNVLVGSWVKFTGTLFGAVANISNKLLCTRTNPTSWIWGASFAFWGKDIPYVRVIFEKSNNLSKELGLSRNPDDYWLALAMNKKGSLEVTNKTHVTPHSKETTSLQALRRNRENNRNAALMRSFVRTNRV